MGRDQAGLEKAVEEIRKLRDEFWQNVKVAGTGETLNKNLEFAGRVADFLELGELMAADALHRAESCGGHFREESRTEEGEAKRDDDNFTFVSAWEFKGDGAEPALHKEQLTFENVKLTTRSYK
jgi:succinate dehydrogenase / fumarate reductase flavoprotein subunit